MQEDQDRPEELDQPEDQGEGESQGAMDGQGDTDMGNGAPAGGVTENGNDEDEDKNGAEGAQKV